MIQANEVRKGNKVFCGQMIATINTIGRDPLKAFEVCYAGEGEVIYFTPWNEQLNYIPLTPEILGKKAGFKQSGKFYEKEEIIILLVHDGPALYHYSNTSDRRATLYYVHQLQNLFFALRGEELKIEL